MAMAIYIIQNISLSPCENSLVVNPNKASSENNKITIGHVITKNNSSRNRVIIVIVVARPQFIPSRLRNIMLKAPPPTEVGVIVEVNSHNIVTLRERCHDRVLSVSVTNLQHIPQSRPTTKSIANTNAIINLLSKLICLKISILNSPLNNHTNTPMPIAIGNKIFAMVFNASFIELF